MADGKKNPPQELVPKGSGDDVSMDQITALVSSAMEGFKPLAEQQARVQMAQIEAGREKDSRAYQFARTTLFTSTAVLIVVLILLAIATAFLFNKGNDQAGLQVIWFGMGALSGFGFARASKSRQ